MIVGLAMGLGCATHTVGPRRPFPQHIHYGAGTIRPARVDQATQDDHVRVFYDTWKARYLVRGEPDDEGVPSWRISVGGDEPEVTVSEGQGYGMMIVVLMAGHDPDAQPIFDGLLAFAAAHPSRTDDRLMAWQVPEDPEGNDSAFDGDADIAYALLLAHRQWGGEGTVDYRAVAAARIAALVPLLGPDSRLAMLGDWVDPDGEVHNQFTTRSSDFIPDHFRAFARVAPPRPWREAIRAGHAAIASMQAGPSSATGLLPDFLSVLDDGAAVPVPLPFLEGEHDDAYYYNAGRVPWRLGTDALLFHARASRVQAQMMSSFVQRSTAGDPSAMPAGYELDGAPVGDYLTTLFLAPMGVAAMTDPDQQAWLDDIYDHVYQRHEGYFEDTVTLLCLLLMTGNRWRP